MKYTEFAMIQKRKKGFVTDWAYKEGVFKTGAGDYIARIKKHGYFTTLSRHATKKAAEKVYNENKQ